MGISRMTRVPNAMTYLNAMDEKGLMELLGVKSTIPYWWSIRLYYHSSIGCNADWKKQLRVLKSLWTASSHVAINGQIRGNDEGKYIKKSLKFIVLQNVWAHRDRDKIPIEISRKLSRPLEKNPRYCCKNLCHVSKISITLLPTLTLFRHLK